MRSPIVLITTDRAEPEVPDPPVPNEHGRIRPPRPKAWVYEAYVEAVARSGGVPLLVPPGPTDIDALLAVADAIVLTGGDMDIHPSHYGEEVEGRIDRIEPARTDLELHLARAALARGVPVLGICGGMQVLAVAAGGSLVQDLPVPDEAHPDRIRHEQLTDPARAHHEVRCTEQAIAWFGDRVMVNSTHHQAIKSPGSFEVVGTAPDGVIEVIAHPTHPFAAGAQWHPELLGQLGMYEALVTAAKATFRT
jgi:putative glutamine amidotransferase